MNTLNTTEKASATAEVAQPTFYKIGCLMGGKSYVASSEGKQYATEEQCQNAIANLIAEQQTPKNAFAVLKFIETEVIPSR